MPDVANRHAAATPIPGAALSRGKLGDDGVERVSTQSPFDLLEVPQLIFLKCHSAAGLLPQRAGWRG
jgi:hypothetical protein